MTDNSAEIDCTNKQSKRLKKMRHRSHIAQQLKQFTGTQFDLARFTEERLVKKLSVEIPGVLNGLLIDSGRASGEQIDITQAIVFRDAGWDEKLWKPYVSNYTPRQIEQLTNNPFTVIFKQFNDLITELGDYQSINEMDDCLYRIEVFCQSTFGFQPGEFELAILRKMQEEIDKKEAAINSPLMPERAVQVAKELDSMAGGDAVEREGMKGAVIPFRRRK